MANTSSVVTITVTRGTAITVFAVIRKVTRETFNPTTNKVTLVPADPTSLKYVYEFQGSDSKTTWTWTTGGETSHIVKLGTGVFVASIPTSKTETGTATKLLGLITATGPDTVTVTGQFQVVIRTTKL